MTNIWKYRAYKLYSCIAYALPLAILFAINSKAYISSSSRGIGFFGYLILAFMVIGFKSKLQEIAKKNTILTVSAVVFVVALIMQYLATQLLLISGMSLAGSVLSAIIEPVADVYYAKSYEHSGEKRIKKQEPVLPTKNAWRIAYGFRV